MRRMKICLAMILSCNLLFSAGCSYISTMDPNDNSRLAALKEESRQAVLAERSGMSLKAFQQNVEALKSARLIFRTHLDGEGLVLEAFTNPGVIKDTLDSVFSNEPDLLDRVTIVNGRRGEEDRLPDSLLPEDPAGSQFSVQLESSTGQLHDHALVTLEEGSGNAAEMLLAELRQLLLVGESLPRDPEGVFYRIGILAKDGQPLGELILDDGQMVHARTAAGEERTYLLMNPSQWSGLKNRLDQILSQADDGAEEPAADGSALGFELPWNDPDALIGQASHMIEDEEDPSRTLYIEAAVLGRISPNRADLTLEEEFSALWLLESEATEEGERFMTGYRQLSPTEAERTARELGYEDTVADLLARVREEARYNFLSQANREGLILDPGTRWR